MSHFLRSSASFNDIEQLNQQLNEQISYNNTLLEQLKQYEEQSLSQRRKQHQDAQTLSDLQAETSSYRQEVRNLRSQLRTLSQEREKENSFLSTSSKELTDLRSKLRLKTETLTSAEDKLRRKDAELVRLREQHSVLIEEVADLSRTKDSVKSQSEVKLSQVISERDSFALKNSELQTTLNQESRKLKSLTNYIDDLKSQLSAAQTTSSSSTKRVSELELSNTNMLKEKEDMVGQINILEDQNWQLRSDVERLTGQVVSLSEDLNQTRHQVDEERQQINQRIRELDVTRKRLEDARNEVSKSNEHLNEEKQMIADQLRHTERRADQLMSEKLNLENSIDQLKKELAEVGSQKLFDAEQKMSEKITSLTKQYTSLQGENTKIHDMLRVIQNEKAQLLKRIEEVQNARVAEVNDKEEEMMEVKKQYKQKEHQLRAEIDRVKNSHEKEVKRLQSRITSLQDRCLKIKSAVTSVSRTEAELVDILNAGRVLFSSMKSSLSDVEKVQLESTQKLVDVEEELNHQLMRVKKERDDLLNELDHEKNDVNQSKLRVSKLEDTVASLNSQISSLNFKIEGLQEENKNLKESSLSELNSQTESYHRKLADFDEQNSSLREALETSNQQRRELQEAFDSLQNEYVEAQDRNREVIGNLEKEIRSLKSYVNDYESTSNVVSNDKERLAEQVTEYEDKLQELTSSNDHLSKRVKELESAVGESGDCLRDRTAALNDSIRRYQTQLEQTRGLLLVVQEQRKQLQQENTDLRSRMDSI
ncbi:hypothetical protein GEMRC1_013775 [Eukaryota sp. GEM-RC1]